MIEIEGPADVPQFADEDEEAEFWATHCLGEKFAARLRRVDASQPFPARLRHASSSRRER